MRLYEQQQLNPNQATLALLPYSAVPHLLGLANLVNIRAALRSSTSTANCKMNSPSPSSSAAGADHVTTYIFGSVSKRRPTQQSLLTVSASSTAVAPEDSVSASSRRSSACVSAMKRGSSAVGSVHSGGSGHTSTDPGEQVNGHSGEDSEDDRGNSVPPAAVAAAAAAASARFTCPLCKRQLSEPRVLPCLHAFCTACLRELDSVPAETSGSEIALWNGDAEGTYPGGRVPQTSEDQNGGAAGGSSAGSTYESEEPARDLGWSPLTNRRRAGSWRRNAAGANSTPASNSGSARIIVCPTCGAEARIPSGGVLMFPLHHVLQHRMLLASLARDAAGAAGSIWCDLCSTDIQATARCSDCLLSLCTFCSEAHQRQRRTAAHEVLPLQEARRRGTRILRQQLCPAHPGQETRFFCESCGQVACRDCCVTFHRDHRPPPELVSRIAPSYISAMRDVLERARPLAEGVRAAVERLQLLEQRIQKKASSVQEDVDSHMDAWMEALEAHRRALTLQVRKARESKLQAVRAQQLELDRRSGDVSTAVRFAEELLNEGSEVEVMSTATPLLRRLEWCCSGAAAEATAVHVAGGSNSSSSSSTAGERASVAEHVSTVPGMPKVTRVSDYLEFLPGEVSGRTVEGLPLYGVVTTQTCAPSHCRIDMDALSTCRQHRRVEVLLVTRDAENQPIGHGGADVTADVRARDPTRRPLAVHIADRGDGTYLISFLPDAAGNYTMTVLVQNKPIHGSPFMVYVRPLRPHSGIFHCCTFCSSNGSKEVACGCGGKMPGGYRGCGHGHTGHPGRRHWSCCGSVLESSECGRGTASSASVYQFPL